MQIKVFDMTSVNNEATIEHINSFIRGHKVVTSQRIFQDEVTVKGGHTVSYEAAARDAYKKISSKVGDVIANNIEL